MASSLKAARRWTAPPTLPGVSSRLGALIPMVWVVFDTLHSGKAEEKPPQNRRVP